MKKFLKGTAVVFYMLWTSVSFSQEKEPQLVIENRYNSVEKQGNPYVILISADGFRHDYIEKYEASFLKEKAAKGVRSEALIPSFPSVTFPNHYTIVTGMYPSHHGLVGNSMLDISSGERYSLRNQKAIINPKWYGGTPIWVLAEQQGLLTACYYWPGSEAPIQGVLPTYYYRYSEKSTIDDRIHEVEKWLGLPEEVRPHLITFYMPETDHAGHKFGPDAPETEDAVDFVDASIRKLEEAVSKFDLPVYFVFVSDHGMTAVDQKKPIAFPIEVDPEKMQLVSNGTYVNVFVKDSAEIEDLYQAIKAHQNDQFEVYRTEDVPSHLHFNKKEDRFGRIGDLVLFAKAPYLFWNGTPIPGAHGYDPYEVSDMGATFLMWGNGVKSRSIDKVENIHIYPLLAKLLGLEIQHEIDGDERLIQAIL